MIWQLFSSCILIYLMELLEVSDLLIALVKYLLHLGPVKSLICTENHNMIEQIIDLVLQLVVVTVLCSDNSFGSFLADLLAYEFSAAVPFSNCFFLSLMTSKIS